MVTKEILKEWKQKSINRELSIKRTKIKEVIEWRECNLIENQRQIIDSTLETISMSIELDALMVGEQDTRYISQD